MRPRSSWLAITALLALPGCWSHIDDHCRGCTVLSERAPDLPQLRGDGPAAVLLVHGAFGFGDEWDAVVDALRKANLEFVAWSWSGPWRSPPRSTARFATALQRMLDALPAAVPELVVIAHSAGGALIENAARRVRVPDGHRLRVLAVAPARSNLSASRDPRFSDDAMGQSLVFSQRTLTRVPPGVSIEEYLTEDQPAVAEPVEPGFSRSYLGARVDHNGSVPLVVLPVVEQLAHRR